MLWLEGEVEEEEIESPTWSRVKGLHSGCGPSTVRSNKGPTLWSSKPPTGCVTLEKPIHLSVLCCLIKEMK